MLQSARSSSSEDWPSKRLSTSATSSSAHHRSTENGSSGSSTSRKKVTRSRHGCLTCRARRKGCDLGKPSCQACMRLDRVCVWPIDESVKAKKVPEGQRRMDKAKSAISDLANGHGGIPQALETLAEPLGLTDETGLFDITLTKVLQGNREPENEMALYSHTDPSLTALPSVIPDDGPPFNSLMDASLSAIWPGVDDDLFSLFLASGPVAQQDTPAGPSTYRQLPEQYPADDWSLSLLPDGADGDEVQAGPSTYHQQPDQFPAEDGSLSLLPNGDEAVNLLWNAGYVDSSAILFPPNSFQNDCAVGPVVHLTASSQQPSPTSGFRPPLHRISNTIQSHRAHLYEHYTKSLSLLVSVTGTDSPSGFMAFSALSSKSIGLRSSSYALHLAILGWSGRHLVNQGQVRYEAASESYGTQAIDLLGESFKALSTAPFSAGQGGTIVSGGDRDIEEITLLAGILMVMQQKICRGDVWGFDKFVAQIRALSRTLARSNPRPGTMKFNLLENLAYHDILSSRILTQDPIVDYSFLAESATISLGTLRTLTGLSFPIFVRMHQTASLVRERRAKQSKDNGVGVWTDENMLGMVDRARKLEIELQNEKEVLDTLVIGYPSMQRHRYLHEAFRVACLLQLHTSVMCIPPMSFTVRMLVRQALSLLETITEQDIPGYCSAHWVLFMTGLCASGEGHEPGKPSDRERVKTLYVDMLDQFGFHNVPRSKRIVNAVWDRNEQGKVFVDWLDIVAEYDWDLFLV